MRDGAPVSVRPAVKAGSWYPGDPDRLAAVVDSCLKTSERLFKNLSPGGKPLAAVVPHAGLAYSGAVAAAAFRWLAAAYPDIEAFVVFGACHGIQPPRPAVWNRGAWDSPFGQLAVDEELAAGLVAAGAGSVNEAPHLGDNAIELLVPFIQRLFPSAKMAPVAMPPLASAHRFGELAARAAADLGRRAVALASTDLTHYGAAFGVMPAGTGKPALEWAGENDRRFLEPLLDLDLERIVVVAKRDGSACGAGAAAAAAGWAKAGGCAGGTLLAYANSHEIAPAGTAAHFVGYAAVAFA